MSKLGREVSSWIESVKESASQYPTLKFIAGKPSDDFGGWEDYLSTRVEDITPTKAQRILDVGGGFNMQYASRIAAEQSDTDVFCSDILDVNNINNNVKYVRSDACNLPYENETFDLVYSKSFFSHVYSHTKALNEQIRVLKPGGKLIIMDESLLNPERLLDWLVLWPLRTSFESGGPLWLLTKDEIKTKNGMKYKTEDHYTAFYWSKILRERDDLEFNNITSPNLESRPQLHSIGYSNEFKKIIVSYSTYIVVIGTKL